MALSSARPQARYAATTADSVSWDWMRPAAQMAAPATDPEYDDARIATRTLSLEHVSVRRARDFTLATLRRWGLAPLADDMSIVVSELLTNALRYGRNDRGSGSGASAGGWPIRLGLMCPGGCVLCAVADPSREVPVMREPDFLAETGRGLHVVDSLSDNWGCTLPRQDGKVVWALLVPQWRLEPAGMPAGQVLDSVAGSAGSGMPVARGTSF